MKHEAIPSLVGPKHAINFAKYHGNGNDFIIIDSLNKLESDFVLNASYFCDRNRGIGADGILLVEEQNDHLLMKVINADGSLAKNCGNGLRCASRWYFDNNPDKESLFIILDEKSYQCKKVGDLIEVAMGVCTVFLGPDFYFSSIGQKALMFTALIGNEHLLFVFKENIATDFHQAMIQELKEKVASFDSYNCGFLFENAHANIAYVWERGVGFTKSCGSNACALAAALVLKQAPGTKDEMPISQPGGEILVKTHVLENLDEGSKVGIIQKGHAEAIFHGTITLGAG